jgi:hypothetical protein
MYRTDFLLNFTYIQAQYIVELTYLIKLMILTICIRSCVLFVLFCSRVCSVGEPICNHMLYVIKLELNIYCVSNMQTFVLRTF